MENHSQGLLVKSVCAFHYQATAQPKVFTIQKFNRPLFLLLGYARLHFSLNTANVKVNNFAVMYLGWIFDVDNLQHRVGSVVVGYINFFVY